MAQQGGIEQSRVTPLIGSFSGTGQSATFNPVPGRAMNMEIRGTFVATIQLERTFDEGKNWVAVSAGGSAFQYAGVASEQFAETEPGVGYRLNCTAYTSGTPTYRLSQ